MSVIDVMSVLLDILLIELATVGEDVAIGLLLCHKTIIHLLLLHQLGIFNLSHLVDEFIIGL